MAAYLEEVGDEYGEGLYRGASGKFGQHMVKHALDRGYYAQSHAGFLRLLCSRHLWQEA
jgi:hypothetical protein